MSKTIASILAKLSDSFFSTKWIGLVLVIGSLLIAEIKGDVGKWFALGLIFAYLAYNFHNVLQKILTPEIIMKFLDTLATIRGGNNAHTERHEPRQKG